MEEWIIQRREDLPALGTIAILAYLKLFGKCTVARQAENTSAYIFIMFLCEFNKKLRVIPEGPVDFSLKSFKMSTISSGFISGVST